MTGRKYPTKKAIIEAHGRDYDGDWMQGDFCWACEFDGPVERAHIIAHVWGGSDEASNFVLLCHECHREMDAWVDALDPKVVWAWIETHESIFERQYRRANHLLAMSKELGIDSVEELFDLMRAAAVKSKVVGKLKVAR